MDPRVRGDDRRRKMRKKRNPLVGLILLLIILGVVGYFGVNFYINSLKGPLDVNGQAKGFVISDGETASKIADRLEKEKVIKSAWAFKMVYKGTLLPGGNKDSGPPEIPTGDFVLSPAMSVEEIIKTLTKGSVDVKVTLIEGWRAEEEAAKLHKELGIDEKEFLKAAKEGYMFPDTYFFNPKVKAADIAATLQGTFEQRYDSELQSKVKAHGLTPAQGVILASIVEREARSLEVRTKVASILLHRIKIGMKLDADSTVQYAMGQDSQSKMWWRTITQDDYKFNSPYNTYLNNGLPPGPICNPSLSSLQAVANADASTPYLYYYHDSQGNSYYAKTLEEHNANVESHR